MGQCKVCGKSGFMLVVDNNGLCARCQVELYPQLLRTIEIIKESEKIIQESRNYKTRLSRCSTIVELLQRFAPYEAKGIRGLFNKSIPECIQHIEDVRNGVIADAIVSVYEDIRAKVKVASTPKSKIKACNDGILKLRELAKECGYQPKIERAVKELLKHAHMLEYKSFIDAAQKAEFKDNLKKALDQYQEALYFLRNDGIDDSEQQREIASLEAKIEELKGRIGTPKTKPAVKRIPSDSQ